MSAQLKPAERQKVLRVLKFAPKMTREQLARYALEIARKKAA